MSKSNEVISLYFGEGGCGIGSAMWNLFCLEHNIRPDGVLVDPELSAPPHKFFFSTGANKVVPRAAFIDLDPLKIDEIRTGPQRALYNPNFLISGKEDTGNCFATGYFQAKEIMEMVMQRIRMMAELCAKVKTFLIFRAYSGGTGSGFVSSFLEHLSNAYPQTDKLEFSLFPAPKLSSIVVEPYNAAMAIHNSLEHANGSIAMDNEACLDLCESVLNICTPSLDNINHLISCVTSSMASCRFPNSTPADFGELKRILIPYPRLQYLIPSYVADLYSCRKSRNVSQEGRLISSCFEPANQLLKCDLRKGKCVISSMLFQGKTNNAVLDTYLHTMKTKVESRLGEWFPQELKIGTNSKPPLNTQDENHSKMKSSCTMVSNSTVLKTALAKINRRFDILFSKNAFLHWYLAEGLEKADFYDTRLDLAALENDYVEIEKSQCSTM